MDEYDPKLKLSHLVETYKEFCFIALRQAIPISTSVFWICNTVMILQVLTLIIIPFPNNQLPWSSSSIKSVWTVIAYFCRPDLFAYFIEKPMFFAICFLIVFSVYLSLRIILLYLIFKRIGQDVRSIQALKNLTDSPLLKLDSVFRYILFEIGFIPILNVIIELPSLMLGNYSSQYLMVSLVIPYSILCIEHSLCFQTLFYSQKLHKELISIPFYAGIRKSCIFIIVFGVRYIEYPKHWFIYSTVLLCIGVFLAYQFIMKQPYYFILMNIMEVCKGIMLAWGSVILFIIHIGQFQDDEKVLATCLYFIPLPCFVYLAKEIMIWRHKLLLQQNEFHTLTQLFHILMNDLVQNPHTESLEHVKSTIILHVKHFDDSIFINIWLCSYFLSKGCYLEAKILVSKIQTSPDSWVLLSYKQYIIERYRQAAKYQLEETEAENYIKYSQMISDTLIEDSIVCNSLNSFYAELLYRKPKSSTLSSTIEVIFKNLNKTQNMYKILISMFDNNFKLLDYFSGFLDATQNSSKASNYSNKAQKASRDYISRLNKDAEIKFFDPKSLVMIISLSKKNTGQIIWATNSLILGYLDYELEQSSFNMLIPEPISTYHDKFLTRSTDLWASHLMLTSILDLFVKNRSQCLVPVRILVRLVILNSGKLAILTAIKENPNGQVCGFLDSEGRYLTCITAQMSQFLSHLLEIQEDKLLSVDLYEIGGFIEWQADSILCEGFSPLTNNYLYVCTKELYFGSIAQKLIVLTELDHTVLTTARFNSFSSDFPCIRPELESYQKLSCSIKRSVSLENKRIELNEFSSLISSKLSSKDTEKAIIRLKNQAYSNLNKKILYLSIGIVIFGSITIVLFTVIGIIHKLTVMESYDATKLISTCAEISLSSIHIASLAKELYLYDTGIVLNNTREGIIDMLTEEADSILEESKEIYNSINVNTFSEKILNTKVIYWYYNEGSFSSEHINLVDYTKQISYLAANLAGSFNATSELRDFIELYRNGNSQVMRILNTTMFDLIDNTEEYIEYRFNILHWLTLVSVLIMLLAILLLIVYPLYKIHILRKEIWKHIFHIPKTILQVGYTKIRDRLNAIHFEETLDPIILRNKFDNNYSLHKLQVILYLLLSILILSIISYLMIINFQEIPKVVLLLYENVVSTAWIKLKSISLYNMIYLLREQAYPLQLFPTNTFHYSPDVELHRVVQNSYYVHKRCREVDSLSPEIFNYFYEESADYPYGYHSFSLDLLGRVTVANQLLQEDFSYLEIGGINLEQEIFRYQEITESLKDTETEEFDKQMMNKFDLYLTFTLMALGLIAVFVIFAIFPVIWMLRSQIGYEASVLVLLPKDDTQFVVQAFNSLLII